MIIEALRRAYWAIRRQSQPQPALRSMEGGAVFYIDLPRANDLPHELHIRYPMPSGGGWIKLSDWALNRRMQEEGNGWAGMCAVEIWRGDFPKSSAVFSSWLMTLNRDQAVGMYWRPMPHGRYIPTTVQ